ncbi:endonuclease/exonuclease/phosphatase family protein [Pseudoalteromonas holothuriae]|nr:endonuclease/exonuclease/phosphatase family protein [Pseudoalteromonas sp. CIP111854]
MYTQIISSATSPTRKLLFAISLMLLTACQQVNNRETMQGSHAFINVKVASFNVSMEANNYIEEGDATQSINLALPRALASAEHQQIKNIAEIIQRVQPDILLLNEFDYLENTKIGINAFQNKYLSVSQQGHAPIYYPYIYLAPVNTGVKTPFQSANSRLTHYGFGKYPGQYGMVVLSKYPIENQQTRTFQQFLWQDMPDNLMPVDSVGNSWYSKAEKKHMRLSSKSHWDIPVNICNKQLNILASHPTPPVFDGDEDRNGRRNHDEIRFWKDYITANSESYHYDDQGKKGGIVESTSFVIVGDLNASAVEGSAHPNAMRQLLTHSRINDYPAPTSEGGALNKPDNPNAASHTASWGMRADYVIPSSELKVIDSGVFWPKADNEASRLVSSRSASSDHRLVWATLALKLKDKECNNDSLN